MWDKRPSDWPVVQLRDLATQVKHRNDGRGHPLMTISAKQGFLLQSEKFSRDMAGQSAARYVLLKAGEFAYNKGNSKTAPQGCIIRLDRPSALVPFVYYCFSLGPQIDPNFASHAFKAGILNRELARYINSGVRNDGLLNLYSDDFYRCSIALPPLAEQLAMADVMQSVVDGIGRTRELISATRRARIELLRKFQGPETSPNWPLQTIGSLLKEAKYGLSVGLDGFGSVPVLRMPDIQRGRVNVLASDLKRADISDRELEQNKVCVGDILFNRTNSQELVGKSGIVRNEPTEPITFASYLIRLRTKKTTNPYWLNAVLNAPRVRARLRAIATPGVSQWNINAKSLKKMQVAVPPLADQNRFAELFETIEQTLTEQELQLCTLEQTHTAVTQELLSGRLRLPEALIAKFRDEPEMPRAVNA